jgi:hypothetical protein
MHQRRIVALFLSVMLICTGKGWALAGSGMPDALALAGKKLILNGRGMRTKFFLDLYEAGLYLQKKNRDASSIIAAEEPMAVRLVIQSSLINSEKMEKATLEGFEKSTDGNIFPLEKEIGEFISVFRQEINKEDIYVMIYLPGAGVEVQKNGKAAAVIPGMAFKKALFGIWLGPDPVQESLKKELLDKGE